MRRDTANGDFQMKFSYRDTSPISGPWGQLRFRYVDSNNFGYLTLYPGSFSLSEKRAGTAVTLASGSWTTTSGDWYDVTLIADGSHIEVWRGPKGGAQTRMCSVDTATVLSGAVSYLVVTVGGVYAFDDVEMTAEDLSATTYTYDAANQLTAMNVNGTTTNFTYDDWGRMVGKMQGSYAATYAYRFGDKVKAVTSNFPGETAFTAYNYDGLGRRQLEQRDNTTATWFRWSGSEECGEYAGTVGSWTIGALQTGYVPGLATFAGANPSTAQWRYHLTDHLGSVRQLSGQTKAVLARYDYAPYGELMRSAGLPLTVGYTGHLWDSAIGQYYAPFRYYNPQTARWNMRDPLGFVDGPNVYAYVVGNPVKNIDPLGMFMAADNLPPGVFSFLPGGLGGGITGGILGGLDQAGCGWKSILAEPGTYGYDNRDRLTGAEHRNNLGAFQHSFGYTYDDADNLTQRTRFQASNNQTDTWAYTYNAGNGQQSMTLNGGTPETRTYDTWGRLATRPGAVTAPVMPIATADGYTRRHRISRMSRT